MQGVSQILADALLVNTLSALTICHSTDLMFQIWRCWHILAQRRYSRFALMCLYVAEICVCVVT